MSAAEVLKPALVTSVQPHLVLSIRDRQVSGADLPPSGGSRHQHFFWLNEAGSKRFGGWRSSYADSGDPLGSDGSLKRQHGLLRMPGSRWGSNPCHKPHSGLLVYKIIHTDSGMLARTRRKVLK
jgi:hypothetical protein